MYQAGLDQFKDLIEEAKANIEEKIANSKDSNKKKFAQKNAIQPKVITRQDLIGLELAPTYDENLNDYLSVHVNVEEKEKCFYHVDSLNDVHQFGSLCNITEVQRDLGEGFYNILHIDGLERIKLKNEVMDFDMEEFFLTNAEDKIKVLENKITQMKQLIRMNAEKQQSQQNIIKDQSPDILIRKFEKEKRTLKERMDKVNAEELLDAFNQSKLRMIEYDLLPKDQSVNSSILKSIIGEILTTMRNINRESKVTFIEPPKMSDYDYLNIFSATLASKNVIDNVVLQYLLGLDDLLLKAETILVLLKHHEKKYLKHWKAHTNDSKANSNKQAREQIENLYKTLTKVQDESSSILKKSTLQKVKNSLEEKTYPQEVRDVIMEN